MNTLSRAITTRIFPDTDSYNALRTHWSGLVNSERKRELTAAHYLLYLALRGKDWRKAFTPITSRNKLENGGFEGWAMFNALGTLHWQTKEEELLAPFDGLVTSEMLKVLRSLVPAQSAYKYKPEAFTPGNFPFEAYNVPAEMVVRDADKDITHA